MQHARLTGPLQWAYGVRQRYEQQRHTSTLRDSCWWSKGKKQGDGVGHNQRPGESFQEEMMFELHPCFGGHVQGHIAVDTQQEAAGGNQAGQVMGQVTGSLSAQLWMQTL